MTVAIQAVTLRSSLDYEPRELEVGTTGRRGKVVDLTQLEVYQYLGGTGLPAVTGSLRRRHRLRRGVFLARDLRPSSDSFVPDLDGRGEIAQAIMAAIRDAGMQPINLGLIPTPALACYALVRGRGSMMIT